MPVRLLSSIFGSSAILGEHVSGALEALGMLLVAVTAATYLGNQVLVSRRAQRRRAERGAGAPPPVEGDDVGRGSGEVRQADGVAAGTELASTVRGASVRQ